MADSYRINMEDYVMHLYIYIIVLLFVLILVPIPLKFKINYKNSQRLDFYFYNIKIDRNVSYLREKVHHRIKFRPNQMPIVINSLKITLNSLKRIKFKPKAKMNIDLTYGLGDAAYTAMAYGAIYMFCPILLQLLSLIFKLKDCNFKVHPEYNKYTLRLEINSIIFVNLAKIIYILILVHKNLRKNRKINLVNTQAEGGIYNG